MEEINNDLCKLRIKDLSAPLFEWYEKVEWIEDRQWSNEEIESIHSLRDSCLAQQNELLHYINALSPQFPNKDLYLILVYSLYNYIKGYGDKLGVNYFNLARILNNFIHE